MHNEQVTDVSDRVRRFLARAYSRSSLPYLADSNSLQSVSDSKSA